MSATDRVETFGQPGRHCAGGNATTNAFFPSPGNHDYNGGGIGRYLEYFDLPGESVASSGSSGSELYYDHAPYSSSSSHGSYDALQWPFASWGADAVIAAHDHTYERVTADGIPYFVNGLGGRRIYAFGAAVPGSEVRYNDDQGAMLIEADASRLTFMFVTRRGTTVDTYTISHNPAAVIVASCRDGPGHWCA